MSTATTAEATFRRIRECVERAYRVFPSAPSGTHGASCPCCTTESEVAALWSARRETLAADDLGRYAAKAMTTWGNARDYRYFLPRILELAASDDGRSWMGLGVDLISSKLLYGHWESWPLAEREVLQDYFLASFLRELTGRDELDSDALLHLCAGLRHAEDTEPYWETWRTDDFEALLHLVGILERFTANDRRGWEATWRAHPRALEVHAFLSDPSVPDHLERVALARAETTAAGERDRHDLDRMWDAAQVLRARCEPEP